MTNNSTKLTDEEKRLRARGYRKKYNEKQALKQHEIEKQIQAVEQDIRLIKIANHEEIQRSAALQGMYSYCDSALQLLKAAAASTASSSSTVLRSTAAVQTALSLQEWARHQYVIFPSFIEFLFGKLWTPSDNQIKWIISHTKSSEFSRNHITFLGRTEMLLNELKRYPESKSAIESKLQVVLSVWVRFTEILARERGDVLRDYAVIPQLKKFLESYQSSQSHSNETLNKTTQLEGTTASLATAARIVIPSIKLSDEQMYRLKEIWENFESTIRECRVNLGYDVSNVCIKPCTVGMKLRAEEYLLTLDMLEGSKEYVSRQASALITLFVEFIKLMTPLQLAQILVQCKPLMPQLPFVCTSLLDGFNEETLIT